MDDRHGANALPAWPASPVLALVLGDFGRDAGLRFAAALSREERRRCDEERTAGPFYDEHRRLTLTLVGDLPYAKAPWLEEFSAGRPLDDRILVGFPGGIPLAEVVPRLAVLVLEAMAGPVRRGREEVMVLLPCNTLAPAAWAMEEAFRDATSLRALLERAGAGRRADLADLPDIVGRRRIGFPTVPQMALREAARRRCRPVLPLGTEGIAGVYAEAMGRTGLDLELIRPDRDWQDATLSAIRASIGGRRDEARSLLQEVAADARRIHGERLAVIEACTDLDHGVGWDSGVLYAAGVVEDVYSPSRRRSCSLSESKV